MTAQERLIGTAAEQVGYMGKRSNSQLDEYNSNTSGKWNKYARDLDALGDFYNGKKNGYDWCDVFVDWCFVTTFGRTLGQKLLCQPDKSLGAGTGYSLKYYQQMGRLFSSPEPGDQIFFGDSKTTWHTGIVSKVENGYVHMQLPAGYEAHMIPRSSTYKNFGVIQANHMGMFDESYCGDNDQWYFPAIAMRNTVIHAGDRICQFRIVEHQPTLNFVAVETLGNSDRGGIGSTGTR